MTFRQLNDLKKKGWIFSSRSKGYYKSSDTGEKYITTYEDNMFTLHRGNNKYLGEYETVEQVHEAMNDIDRKNQ